MNLFKVFLFLSIILFHVRKKIEKTSPTQESITSSVYASGIIKTRNQYQVYSTVNGLLKEILVVEGDTVKKGQALMLVVNETAKLNSENAQIAADYATVGANTEKLNELKISIEQAKNKMDNDLSLLQRQRNLWEQHIGTRNELDQRELSYKNDVNSYQAAILRYDQLKKQLNFSAQQSQKNLQISTTIAKDFTIKSETNGKVYNILKEKGEMINTTLPVAIVGDAENFFLELQVDEYDIASIIINQKVIVKLDSYKGQIFEAKVTKINPIMNEKSKSFTIEADFVSKPPALFPNLSAEANIVLQTKDKAILIPRIYLIDEEYVLMENKEKRKVVTGLKDYQKVEIINGLTMQDVILKPTK